MVLSKDSWISFCIVHRCRDIRLLIDGDQQVLLLQILHMNY